jgi:hypothetical protein
MHRNRTWQIDPEELRTQRNRILPIEGGDGSTLSLDFTGGVLDPRLTFTRSTNATFINSQGYVQFADANMFVNSAWTDANNLPAGWTLGTGTGSVSRSNETRTLTCAAQQYWWYQQPASRSGLTYSVSVEVTAVSGTILYGDIILAGSSTTIAWYKDGVLQASGSSTPVTTGVITLIFTANSDNTILRLGLGSAGTNVTGSVTLRYPQFQQGQVPLRSYYENTSTSAARFNSARFDRNPTTLAPRGLLIEGSATNLVARSQALNQSSWLKAATSISETGTGSPANDATSNVLTWTNGTAVGSAYTEQSGLPVSASQPYTWSVWLKNRGNQRVSVFGFTKTAANAFSGNLEMTVDFSVATPTATITTSTNFTSTSVTTPVQFGNGWYRCTMTGTTPSNAAITGFGISNKDAVPASGTNGCEVWGAQLEAGSGASSYIPTGASTGNRAADFCTMTGTNFSSWYQSATSGTVYYEFDNPRASLGSATQPAPVNLGDYSAGNLITGFIGGYTTGQLFACAIWGNGGNGFQSATVPTATSVALGNKSAFAFSGQSVMGAFRGISSSTATTTGTVNAKTIMYVGANGTTGTPNRDFLNSCIQRIKFFPTQYTTAQLQALTT